MPNTLHCVCVVLFLAMSDFGTTGTADDLYASPAAEDVKTQALNWVATQDVTDKHVLDQIGNLWVFSDQPPTAHELFESLITTFALADPTTRILVDTCRLKETPLLLFPEEPLLKRGSMSFLYLPNVRLYYARYLTQHRMYEEALQAFNKIDVKQVVDPASYLFFKAVCHHQLLMKVDGLKTIEKLLNNTVDVPVRFSTVATLMQSDLQAMREQTLDEVARKMSDVQRRLNLGRGGTRVQKVEDEIVATLDQIIKKLEQQFFGGGGGSSGNNQSHRSGNPAQDSGVKGSTAPGNVDKKKIGNKAGWGVLPPRKEIRAKNLINRNFPAHYRKAIEQYFKKLANRRAGSKR